MKRLESAGARKRLPERKLAIALACCLAIGSTAALASCQPQATQDKTDAQASEPAKADANASTSAQAADAPTRMYDSHTDRSTFDNPDALDAYVANRVARDENSKELYKAAVTTLADGTQVQAVPNDVRGYNVGVIYAEERGCTACHSLEDAIEWCPISHNGLSSYGSDPIGVDTCIACHDGQQLPLFGRPGLEMADLMHASHMMSDRFLEQNGNCMSCHYVDSNGNYELWDHAKYDQLQGFTELSDVQGEFSFDQDVLTDNDLCFYQLSASTDPNGIALHSSSDDSVLLERVVKVAGLVDNPIDLKLVDIPEDQLVTRTLKWNCSANGVGDAFIANAQFTGIPFSTICEQAGVTGDAVTLVCEEGKSTFMVDWLLEKNAMLVFKMNGENLPSELGYPCALLTEATGASSSRRYIQELQFVDSSEVKKFKNDVPGTLVPGEEDTYFNKPTGAVLSAQDGQIFTGTDTVTFEGYVDGFDEAITEVAFSLDRGKTWQSFDTSDSTTDRWVYWTYKLSGLEPGSYDLRMRVTTETGRVIPHDVNTIFHIQ